MVVAQEAAAPGPQRILQVWRADRDLRVSSAQVYLRYIARFRRYCREQRRVEVDELTLLGGGRFRAWCSGSRTIRTSHLGAAGSALRALRRVYEVTDVELPPWKPLEPRAGPAQGVLRDYAAHLARHRGLPEATIDLKVADVGKLLAHLAAAGKSWREMRLADIDAFLIQCAGRYAPATTAGIASTIRSFTRFLLASRRIHLDLAEAVISPVQRRFERPRRAWPWEDVQRLLRGVDTSSARGLRDHALLLLMSTYGLGAGEAIRLKLEDIDWGAATLKVSRPKTGVHFVLPLLGPLAKVLARYLRHGRPPHTPTRHVFVQMKVPFGPLTSASAVRHILAKHGTRTGIQAACWGSHVLRHSNAARQVDIGAPAPVLSQLLGHRDSESLSAYVRIATQSLREVSLPVPR